MCVFAKEVTREQIDSYIWVSL